LLVIPATRYGRPYRRVDAAPFMQQRWRPLRLVVDDASLTADDVGLLDLLAAEEEFQLWHTRPDAVRRLELGEPFDGPLRTGGALSVTALDEETGTLFGIYNVDSLRGEAHALAAASDDAEADVFSALCFAEASDEFDADGFVTRRPYLLSRRGRNRPITFCADEAVGLVGLAMRAHRNSSIGQDLRGWNASSNWFHFILGRELLREGWPWFGGVIAHDAVHPDDPIGYLAQTALERFQRVLQIRDRLHVTAKSEPTRSREDEITFELETLLLFLSASFDATARVAHVVYLTGSYENAGWRRDRWLERLAAEAPTLAGVVSERTRARTLLQVIGALRNTIHGESLRAASVQRGGETDRFIRVASREGDRLRRRIDELGETLEAWGISEEGQELALVADRFVERLLPAATDVLNELMRNTDTSRLPGAAGSPLIADVEHRQGARNDDWFSSEVRLRVRRLAGC
jgi:hypothetical protein